MKFSRDSILVYNGAMLSQRLTKRIACSDNYPRYLMHKATHKAKPKMVHVTIKRTSIKRIK
jgi:hypothetical protein